MDALERVNGITSFAYNADGGPPWHRTGQPMQGLQSAEEMLRASYADYHVDLVPLFIQDPETGALIQVEDRQATARINPHTGEYEALATVGNRYHTFQNADVLERALAICGAAPGEAVVETCGVLFEGKRFFAAVDLGALVIDPAGCADRIARYLLVYSSHDGTTPIVYSNTDVRAVCWNTVRLGLNQAAATFKAKHTPGAEVRIEEAQRVLRFSLDWSKEFTKMATKMLGVPMTPGRLDKVIDAAYPAAKADTERQKANRDLIVGQIRQIYDGPKNAGFVGPNGWAAYNAVVEYLDHWRDGTPQERALTSMDDNGWVTRRKQAAQAAVLSLL